MVSCRNTGKAPDTQATSPKDSITLWLEQAEDTSGQPKLRLLEKAYRAVAPLPEDTVKTKHLVELSYQYARTNDSITFRKINTEAIQLSLKMKDSTTLADAYWDIGSYMNEKGGVDSAYYYYGKGQRIYEELHNDFRSAQLLMNMAIQQIDIRDYTGGEVTTVKALRLLQPLQKYTQLHRGYNNLGIIFDELGDYEKALEYHNKALEYLRKSSRRNMLETMTLNNIGVIYKNQVKYKEAIEKYREAQLKNDLYAKEPAWKAKLIDNIAYARFKMGDLTGLPDRFFKALHIRDSLKDVSGLIINKLHLTEYYAVQEDTVAAIKYAHEATDLAASSKNFRDLLEGLPLLSGLEKGEKGRKHLQTYIRISDSLQKAERQLRDKFARIRFETDELVLEKEQLVQDKAISRRWIRILMGLVLIIGVLTLYYYRRQQLYRIRFNKLLKEKEPEKPSASKNPEDPVTALNMSEAALEHIIEKLKVFVAKKQFLRNDISLHSLAKAMNTNPKYLSRVINFYKQKSFISYIHELRIDYVIGELKTNPLFRKYSIKAIAEEAGFNSSEAFSRAFYKKTGIYPSYFVQELQKKIKEQPKEEEYLIF